MSVKVKEQEVVEVGKSNITSNQLFNFFKENDLSFLKKFVLKGDKLKNIHDCVFPTFVENQKIAGSLYIETCLKSEMESLIQTFKKGSIYKHSYVSIDSLIKFSVTRDLTCCGVTHYLNFANVYTSIVNRLLKEAGIKEENSYSALKEVSFIKKCIFQDMIFSTINKLYTAYDQLQLSDSTLTIDDVINRVDKSVKAIDHKRSLQYRAIVAPGKTAMNSYEKNPNFYKDNKSSFMGDSQIGAFIALSETPYFEEKSSFINYNSGNICVNFEALFGMTELIEVLRAAKIFYRDDK